MILITGAAGYIGSHLSLELIKKYKVLGIDNFSNSNIKVIRSIKKNDKKKNFKFYKVDLRNKKDLEKIFKKLDIKILINCAALIDVNESMIYKKKYFLNNVTTLKNILELMKKYNCKKIVHCSTAALYDVNNKVPFNEKSKVMAVSVYSKTKLQNEREIMNVKNKFLEYYLLRFFNPFGINKKLEINNFSKRNNIFANILNSIKQKNIFYINGNNWPTRDGTCIRDYITINDLISAFNKLVILIVHEKIKKNQIINIGSGNNLTILELIKLFEKFFKTKIKYKFSKKLKHEVFVSSASIKKAEKILKWKPRNDYRNALVNMFKYDK